MSNDATRTALAAVKDKQQQNGTAPAEQPRLINMLQSPRWAEAFAEASPKGLEATQIIRDVMTAARTDTTLLQANPHTVIGAAMTCAQLGLRVGSAQGHAWIVPFKEHGVYVAQLIIGYQGYRELAFRSSRVRDLIARGVHENDFFRPRYGTVNELTHEPPERGQDRGAINHYYAVVTYTSGGHAFWDMSRAEIEAHRDKYVRPNKDGSIKQVWRDHFHAMAAKTCFRKLSPWIPKSPELEVALAADHTVRVDLDPEAVTSGYVPSGGEPLDAEVVPPEVED